MYRKLSFSKLEIFQIFLKVILKGIFFPFNSTKLKERTIRMKTRLKELRLEKNLTQTQLSLHTNISQSSLCKMETECANVNGSQIVALSQYFGVSTDYFLCMTNEKLPVDVKIAIQRETTSFQKLFYYYSKLNSYDKELILNIAAWLERRT